MNPSFLYPLNIRLLLISQYSFKGRLTRNDEHLQSWYPARSMVAPLKHEIPHVSFYHHWMFKLLSQGKIQGHITSGFRVGATISWCPNSWMSTTKTSWITRKKWQNTLQNFPGQRVVLSEYNQHRIQYWNVLKLAKKPCSVKVWILNKVPVDLRVSVCLPVRHSLVSAVSNYSL